MLGAPFKPSFGLSGMTALDVPLPVCHPGGRRNKDASLGFVKSHGVGKEAQDCVLGHSQPSLAGLFLPLIVYPGLASWATFRRPCGTEVFVSGVLTQTLETLSTDFLKSLQMR